MSTLSCDQLTLTDHVPVGMFIVGPDYTVQHWNSCLEEWTRIPREAILGRDLRERFPHLGAAHYRARLQGVFEGGPPVVFSSQLHHFIIPCPLSDGRMRIQHTTVTPIPAPDGQSYCALFALQDVTDLTKRVRDYRQMHQSAKEEAEVRRLAEERLQRYAAELEERNEEIRNLAYIISHDLRAPLVNLKGFAAELRSAVQTIAENLDPALPYLSESQRNTITRALQEDVGEALGFIDFSVSRMDEFLKAVLRLSRLGRQELVFESVDVETIAQEALASLTHQVEQRHATIQINPLPPIVADRTSMEQIVGNLLSNAVKYLDPTRPGYIEVGGQQSAHETIYYVKDNGRGIAEDDLPKVFIPFRRLGKQDTPGEGIGLTYVQTLVRRHGGRIWCESSLGQGTTFIMSFSHLAQ